jgi:predicted TIM-barrel fold metal-dependent hydrolase
MRRFALLCASLLALSASAAPRPTIDPPLIDYHQHFFSPDLAKLVGADTIDAAKLITLLDSAGIPRALVLSVAYSWSNPSRNVPNDYEHVKAENDWVASQVARYPDRLRAFCSVNPLRDYALREIERCTHNPELRRGLKLHIGNAGLNYHTAQDLAKLREVFRAANKNRMAVVIHMRASVNRHLPYGAEEARIFLDSIMPEARDIPVQIAHLAGAGGYDGTTDSALAVFVDAIAKRDSRTRKLWFDVTTVSRNATDDDLKLLAMRIRQLGLERVLFGSDAATGGNLAPRESWADFLKVPLTEAEFNTIAHNVAPYMK